MDRSSIIKELLDSKLLETCVDYQIKKNPTLYKFRDDILQDAWVWLLTYDEGKLLDAALNNHLNALITGYLTRTLHSSTSEFYRKYRRHDMTQEITQQELNIPNA